MLAVYSVGPNLVKIWLQRSLRYIERSKKNTQTFHVSHLVDVQWRKTASERRVLLLLGVISFFLPWHLQSSVSVLGTSEVSRCHTQRTWEGWWRENLPSLSRPAQYRQLQCLLAPCDVLPVYFRNYRRRLDVGRRISILIGGWAAHLKLPAGIGPHGYS